MKGSFQNFENIEISHHLLENYEIVESWSEPMSSIICFLFGSVLLLLLLMILIPLVSSIKSVQNTLNNLLKILNSKLAHKEQEKVKLKFDEVVIIINLPNENLNRNI